MIFMKNLLFFCLFVCSSVTLIAQPEICRKNYSQKLNEGIAMYNKGDYSNAARNEHCQTNRPAQGGNTMPAGISFRPSDRHRQLLLPRTWSEASFRFWAHSRRCHPKAEHRKQDTVSRKAGAYCQITPAQEQQWSR